MERRGEMENSLRMNGIQDRLLDWISRWLFFESAELNDDIMLDRLHEIAANQSHDKDECPNVNVVSPVRLNKANFARTENEGRRRLIISTNEHNRRVAMSE